MPALPVDTSLTGYVSGSVDNQDIIYRNRQRPQPYPLQQNYSGYESGTHFSLDRFTSSAKSVSSVAPSSSLLSLANWVKSNELLENDSNFASQTTVDCYQSDSQSIKRQCLDEISFHECLTSLTTSDRNESDHRIVVFFSALELAENATYKVRSSFSKAAIEALFSRCNLNLLFVPDLLGRPNYWSPELYSQYGKGDLFCQQPRFVIHGPGFRQRSPVSIYMRYEAARRLTYYIISAPESEESVKGFRTLLDLATYASPNDNCHRVLLQHPLEAHILLSKILCESSQGYINLFRQSMFAQLRVVDELSIQDNTTNRKALADVTIELQIISKDVNKLISDVDVASRTLVKTQEALARFEEQPAQFCFADFANQNCRRQFVETLQYLHSSMDKQKMWLYNYRDRKDIAMSLVFNLVTQQDATNNIELAREMKRDSSSMNWIALLTMLFLPGTFTSTVLGAGLFSTSPEHRGIQISGIWWFWAAITFPLTGAVLLLWGVVCWRKEIYSRLMGRSRRKKNDNQDDVSTKA